MAQEDGTLSEAITTHLELSNWRDEFSIDFYELTSPFEDVFNYVSTRVGISGEDLRLMIREAALSDLTAVYGDEIPDFPRPPAALEGRIVVAIAPPQGGPCGMRASASQAAEHPIISIYTDRELDREYLLGILAHEIGHILHFFGYEGVRNVDGLIKEGFASWAAGRYWLEWQGFESFQEAVRVYLANGTYLPLREIESSYAGSGGQDCLELRDTVYTEWASFVEYLLNEYGQDKLKVLFRFASAGRLSPGLPVRDLPDYVSVYGKPLDQLESEWLESIGLE